MSLTRTRLDRRYSTRVRPALLAAPLGLALFGAAGWQTRQASAAPNPDAVPTTGDVRLSPRGFNPGDLAPVRGARPVAIAVDAAAIDAEIEYINIVDGVMENPTGPYLVAWYEDTTKLGEIGNALFAAHVDWHTTGPAVFYNIRNLVEGDEVVLTGDDGELYTYTVLWQETVEVATLTPERLQELVGQTDEENVTLITCGGVFDYNTGHYDSRTVVRCERRRR